MEMKLEFTHVKVKGCGL